MIQEGSKVSIQYTVSLDDGKEVDSNVGEPPLFFIAGQNQVFPALERAILGLSIGEETKVVLSPKEAYGEVVSEGLREVDLCYVPEAARVAGAVIQVKDPLNQRLYPIRVKKIHKQKALLDFNHPLAGENLHFDLKIIWAD